MEVDHYAIIKCNKVEVAAASPSIQCSPSATTAFALDDST